jgi:hypothetical protein
VLHLFRRHYPPCRHTSRRYRRCNCPLWVQGSLGGEWIKKSLNLTSWEAASEAKYVTDRYLLGLARRNGGQLETFDRHLAGDGGHDVVCLLPEPL